MAAFSIPPFSSSVASSSSGPNLSGAASSSTSAHTTIANARISRSTNCDAECVLHRDYRPRLTRQISAPLLGKGHKNLVYAVEEGKFVLSKEHRESKTAHLWDYVERKPNPLGGFINVFRIKDEFDDITPKDSYTRLQRFQKCILMTSMGAAFPAAEQAPSEIISTGIKMRKDPDELYHEGQLQSGSILKRLGCIYQSKTTGFYLEIPDREAFLANWEALQEQYPELFPIDIFSSNGLEDDVGFFHLAIAHDAIYSLGKQASHDFQLHLTELVSIVVDVINTHPAIGAKSAYANMRYNISKAMLIAYRRIMITKKLLKEGSLSLPDDRLCAFKANLNKLEANLGAFADELPRVKAYLEILAEGKPLSRLTSTHFEATLINRVWKNYWTSKRTELGAFDFPLLVSLWREMETIEAAFDAKRN